MTMRFNAWIIIYLLTCIMPSHGDAFSVIAKRENLNRYCGRSDLIMIASPGRSGSKMLTQQIDKYAPRHKTLKTHLLPPDRKCFKGKILFIFANPDKAAESVLFQVLHQDRFGDEHFVHVETADREWLKKIGSPYKQTEQDNLLSYDAFGTYEQLKTWLYTQTKPTNPENAQILAIKYEHLWEEETVAAIRNFLNLPHFKLPPKEERGHSTHELFSHEIKFRQLYNLGTETHPRYAAYDDARVLWEQAPPLQFLRLSHHAGKRK